VTGVDLSSGFIDAATYLTARSGLSDRVTFQVGDALHPPFEGRGLRTVFLQHVGMNIEDHSALYAEVGKQEVIKLLLVLPANCPELR
jgi:hypothetical protein